jgi:hypothetical protein
MDMGVCVTALRGVVEELSLRSDGSSSKAGVDRAYIRVGITDFDSPLGGTRVNPLTFGYGLCGLAPLPQVLGGGCCRGAAIRLAMHAGWHG